MKKSLLLAIPLSMMIAFGACKKEKTEPADDTTGGNSGPAAIAATQQSTIFYMSGNWCGPCGLYGAPAKKAMKTKHGDKMNIIACQLNGSSATDPLNNANANSLAGVFGVTGVPTAYVVANNEGTAVGGGSAMQASMDAAITADIGISDVVANMAIENVKLDGTNLSFDTRTKFFKSATEEYKIAAYVMESGIAGRQYSSGSGWADYDFNDVLRKSVTSSVTGDALITGPAADQEYPKSMTTSIDGTWKAANLKVVVVLWRQVGTTVAVVNSVSVNVQ